MLTSPTSGPIHERILARARIHPDRPAIADLEREFTYGQLASAIEHRASALRAAGIAPGERVVLAARNSVDQLATHLAILHAGAVSVPLAGSTNATRLAFVVDDCDAAAICTDRPTQIGGPRKKFTLHELSGLGDKRLALGDFSVRPTDELACLMYTTGSTGEPKAVMLSHRSLANALAHIIEFLGCSDADREAVVLPLSHSFGLGHAYCTLSCGGFLLINDGLRPLKSVFEAFSALSINAFSTTPSMLRLLLGPYRVPFLQHAAGIRRMVVNSEPLPTEQAADVLTMMPQTDVIAYYGLTEASRSTFLRLRDEPKHRWRSVGKAAPRVEIKICDPAGAPLPNGAEGEVHIRGPHLALGYWQRPGEQSTAFRDGGLYSGDLGVLDREGYLTITGRLKDQINVGGLKVSATEIELILRRHPRIIDVAVTGIPDPQGLRGEVVAVAAVGADSALDAGDIADYCAKNLETAAQPHRIAIVTTIPRAESGKVLKGELQRLIIDQFSGGLRA